MRTARFVLALGVVLLLVSSAEARPRRRRPPVTPDASAETEVADGGVTDAAAAPPDGQIATPTPDGGVTSVGTGPGTTTTAPTGTTPTTTATTATATTPSATTTTPAPPATPPGQLDFRDPPEMPDLTAVRDEIDAIMDELVETRARVAAVGRELFDTRIRIHVFVGAERLDGGVTLSVRLDGLAVYSAEPGDDDDGTQIFEGYAAPGPHVLQVVTERRAADDDDYRASQADTFRFELTRGKMHDVTIQLDDRSDIAEDFADQGEGSFDLRTRVRVRAIDIERATR